MRLDADSYSILTEWFEAHSGSVYRYARLFLHSDIDAQDVVQEVFIRVGEHMHTFRGESGVKTWIFRIAKNYMLDVLKKKRKEKNAYAQGLPPSSSGLNTLVELEDVVAELPEAYRDVFILRLVNDFSVEETAEILGWSLGKVRVTLHRATKKLRKELTETQSVTREGVSDGI